MNTNKREVLVQCEVDQIMGCTMEVLNISGAWGAQKTL